jgi:hypothetical protein
MNSSDVSETSEKYLQSLDEKELIAYNIAKKLLGKLFTLEKSNHYLEWLKSQSD